MSKLIEWNKEKNEILKKTRGISFEEIALKIESGKILRNTNHPNIERYPKQKIFLIEYKNYIYMVPYVTDKTKIFLKTIIPSRKAKKEILKLRNKNEKI